MDSPWYIQNDDIHKDLKIASVNDEIQWFGKKHEECLHKHWNVKMLQLFDNVETVQQLKPFYLT